MPPVSPDSVERPTARALQSSMRPVRALVRGLETLALLNLSERATVAEIAANLRLPRTTAYRILETLCDAGYVRRNPHDDCYHTTSLARMLGASDEEQQELTHCAKSHVHRLSRDLGWPVALATPCGCAMQVREAAPAAGATIAERYSPAFRVPMLSSACGRAWLAHCAAAERAALLATLARSPREQDRAARDPAAARRLLAQVRDRGYATAERPQGISDEISLAVPVALDDRAVGALTVRISSSRVPLESAVERFLQPLLDAARVVAGSMPGAGPETAGGARITRGESEA